jgi:hypothetical protein
MPDFQAVTVLVLFFRKEPLAFLQQKIGAPPETAPLLLTRDGH